MDKPPEVLALETTKIRALTHIIVAMLMKECTPYQAGNGMDQIEEKYTKHIEAAWMRYAKKQMMAGQIMAFHGGGCCTKETGGRYA